MDGRVISERPVSGVRHIADISHLPLVESNIPTSQLFRSGRLFSDEVHKCSVDMLSQIRRL